jgi:predicted protein tyrosine phosphatase
MKQIGDILLFVGVKEEYNIAKQRGMKIVCALHRVKGYVTHQSVVRWQGKGCDPAHPNYLFKRDDNAIYLNMIDSDDPKYVNDEMINPALDFIHEQLISGKEVFIYCSLGESRSPSIALMYLLENNFIERSADTFRIYQKEYYPNYQPKNGNLLYIKNRWDI